MEQLSIFDVFGKPYRITKPIFLIETFAGIGSQAMALKRLEKEGKCEVHHHRVYEIDTYAIQSYNAIHGTNFETTDITKVHAEDLGIDNPLENCYIMTYSFPCTDLSVSGNMLGMSYEDWKNGNATRSGLLWEIQRLLEEITSTNGNFPQVLLLENVTQIHSKRNNEDFQRWLRYLESKGYSNFVKDMSAKNYGVPQSRDRTFVVSILGDYTYKFPDQEPLTKVMRDYLEPTVADNFYVYSDKAKVLIQKLIDEGKLKFTRSDVISCELSGMSSTTMQPDIKLTDLANTICARDYKGLNNYGMGAALEITKLDVNSTQFLGSLSGHGQSFAGGVWNKEHLSPTITTCQGGGRQPHIIETEKICELGHIEKGTGKHQSNVVYDADGIAPTVCATFGVKQPPTMVTEEVRLGNVYNEKFNGGNYGGHVWDQDGLAPTLKCGASASQQCVVEIQEILDQLPEKLHKWVWIIDNVAWLIRIRRIIPLESWRLMDFSDEDFRKAEQVCSNTQLYKQAGNSIVCRCLYKIFQMMM